MNVTHMQTFKIGLNCLQQYNRNMKHYVASKACTMKNVMQYKLQNVHFFICLIPIIVSIRWDNCHIKFVNELKAKLMASSKELCMVLMNF